MVKSELKSKMYEDLYSSEFIKFIKLDKNKARKYSLNTFLELFPKTYSNTQKINFLQDMYENYFNQDDREKCENIKNIIEEMKHVI